MTPRSQNQDWGAVCRRLLATLLVELLAIAATQAPLSVNAQSLDELNGSWVVQRAGDDELAFRLDVSADEARVEVFKRLSYWPVLAESATLSAGDVFVVRTLATGPGTLDLELGDWRAQFVAQSGTTAIFRSPDEPHIGIARRVTAVDPDLLGEWERAELTPAGPRVRRLTVEESRVVFYDRLDRSNTVAVSGVAASGVTASGAGRAIALFPENQSGALIRLYPVGTGFLALEAGDDEFQVVYRPGEAPSWLHDQPGDTRAQQVLDDRPIGRWMVGSGDRSRQTHILDFTTDSASIRRLGDERAEPVIIAAGSSPPHWRISIGTDEQLEHGRMLFFDDDRGVLWRDDDNRYQTLRRIVETPVALSGEWRVERERERQEIADHITIVGDTLRLPARDETLPLFASSAAEAALELTIVQGGRRGLLLRLWSVGEGAFVTDDGDRWYRPGERD